jgi:hypothetical protein
MIIAITSISCYIPPMAEGPLTPKDLLLLAMGLLLQDLNLAKIAALVLLLVFYLNLRDGADRRS